jgi:hypothetical protein
VRFPNGRLAQLSCDEPRPWWRCVGCGRWMTREFFNIKEVCAYLDGCVSRISRNICLELATHILRSDNPSVLEVDR